MSASGWCWGGRVFALAVLAGCGAPGGPAKQVARSRPNLALVAGSSSTGRAIARGLWSARRPAETDQIVISNLPTGEDVWALVDMAQSDGSSTTCVNDVVFLAPSPIHLTGNAVSQSGTSPCASSITIFSKNAAAVRVLNPGWTDSEGDVITIDLPTTRTLLPIRVWITSSSSKARTRLQGHLDTMEELFWDNDVGLVAELQPDAIKTMAEVDGASDATKQESLKGIIGNSCRSAPAITQEASIYDKNALNVYYVDDLVNLDGAGVYGYYCYQQGISNIIFVNAKSDKPHMLAHEVGHALGLIEPNDGHASETDGYKAPEGKNVMAYGGGGHSVFTLGQVFRMNFSQRSWLSSVSNPLSPGPALECPCDSETPQCPPAILRIPGPQASDTRSPRAVCQASGLPLTKDVPCDHTRTLRVSTLDALGNQVKTGFGHWSVDNADVARVTPDATTLGARITGLAPGTAHVTVYVGGPSASQTTGVTVTGSCAP